MGLFKKRTVENNIEKGAVKMDYLNQFSGKPQPFNGLPRQTNEKCEKCGTPLINDCILCGAPICCPKCCKEFDNLIKEEASRASSLKRDQIPEDFIPFTPCEDCPDPQSVPPCFDCVGSGELLKEI